MDINNFAQACHDYALRNGFWDRPKTPGEQIALMHSELSEALEFYRDGQPLDDPQTQVIWTPSKTGEKPDGFFIELGDTVIRIFDTMCYYGVSPEEMLRLKHDYNQTRPYRHGGKAI